MGWRPTGNDNQQHALVGTSQENHQHRNDMVWTPHWQNYQTKKTINKRFLIITILAAGLTNTSWADKQEKLASPNGKIVANINIGKELTYSASFNGEQILKDCPLACKLDRNY